MKLKVLACEALARPIYACAAASPHIVDVELVQRGLHIHPDQLRSHLQKIIDDVPDGKFDAVLLGYGLCGQATAGLVARQIPLVLPRAHDCITLFLGSRQRYQQQFTDTPGTYWYVQDYIERDDGSGSTLSMGVGSDEDLQATYEEYLQKYGKDNADYLIETMGAWQSHYQRAVYIDMGVSDGAGVKAQAQAEAARRGWAFEQMPGDLILLRRLLNADWDKDFLVVPPGEAVRITYDPEIVGCSRKS